MSHVFHLHEVDPYHKHADAACQTKLLYISAAIYQMVEISRLANEYFQNDLPLELLVKITDYLSVESCRSLAEVLTTLFISQNQTKQEFLGDAKASSSSGPLTEEHELPYSRILEGKR